MNDQPQPLKVGEPAQWFVAPSSVNPAFHLDSLGGYHVILNFFGNSGEPASQKVLDHFLSLQPELARHDLVFLGISLSPADQALVHRVSHPKYVKFIWDFDREVSKLYGLLSIEDGTERFFPTTIVLNPLMQIAGIFPWTRPATHAAEVLAWCTRLPPIPRNIVALPQAPVLRIPNVLSPEECRVLINRYRQTGGGPSGIMLTREGQTIGAFDNYFKRRRDINLEDHPDLLAPVNRRLEKRLLPYVERAFRFRPTRFERYLIACYDSGDHGGFLPHRDNNTPGTAHRRFAMSLHLNVGEYEGGDLHFPEFGRQAYRGATGEATVFSCALLHEVTPVTQGQRYVLLCFFYDEEDARRRDAVADPIAPPTPS
ncbi:peroxiredoxin [Fluviicoccus keumensis]|uniref:Peroxiredoxin n=1 Tax=Fluviicoccus keumensis TaxID=1435465 RepID=A0A4Q7YLG1_9GAMM|nr:2OG-Fe(II) oxygenase [Fluviicoccus keumensis]RZU38170.1 peroxiredoxin [Fluviicoccus keumensis]